MIDRAEVLPEHYADRIPADALRRLNLFDRAGEYGELVSELLATLVKHGAPVSDTEQNELRELAAATGQGAEFLDGLTVRE